jgi:uncharacterized protein (DUF433 family)
MNELKQEKPKMLSNIALRQLALQIERLETELQRARFLLAAIGAPNVKQVPTEHPHIERVEDICGGEPVIKGTRTPVRIIIQSVKLGETVAEIVENLPHLTPAQVYDALSYYYDNIQEIEEHIVENEREYEDWQKKNNSLSQFK